MPMVDDPAWYALSLPSGLQHFLPGFWQTGSETWWLRVPYTSVDYAHT